MARQTRQSGVVLGCEVGRERTKREHQDLQQRREQEAEMEKDRDLAPVTTSGPTSSFAESAATVVVVADCV